MRNVRSSSMRWMVVAMTMALLAWSGRAANAAECMGVDILDAPSAAHPGDSIAVLGEVLNCGSADQRYRVEFYLVDARGQRVGLSRDVVFVPVHHAVQHRFQIDLPHRLRPGDYHLVMVGRAHDGSRDADRHAIAIR